MSQQDDESTEPKSEQVHAPIKMWCGADQAHLNTKTHGMETPLVLCYLTNSQGEFSNMAFRAQDGVSIVQDVLIALAHHGSKWALKMIQANNQIMREADDEGSDKGF